MSSSVCCRIAGMDDSVDRKPTGTPGTVVTPVSPVAPVVVSFSHLHGAPPVPASSGGARGGAVGAYSVSSIAAGYYHCAVVFANGTVATWGRNQCVHAVHMLCAMS